MKITKEAKEVILNVFSALDANCLLLNMEKVLSGSHLKIDVCKNDKYDCIIDEIPIIWDEASKIALENMEIIVMDDQLTINNPNGCCCCNACGNKGKI